MLPAGAGSSHVEAAGRSDGNMAPVIAYSERLTVLGPTSDVRPCRLPRYRVVPDTRRLFRRHNALACRILHSQSETACTHTQIMHDNRVRPVSCCPASTVPVRCTLSVDGKRRIPEVVTHPRCSPGDPASGCCCSAARTAGTLRPRAHRWGGAAAPAAAAGAAGRRGCRTWSHRRVAGCTGRRGPGADNPGALLTLHTAFVSSTQYDHTTGRSRVYAYMPSIIGTKACVQPGAHRRASVTQRAFSCGAHRV